MSTKLLNTSYNIGAYNSAGNSYNSNAYTFRVEVLLNSQNEDNLTSNITINWYIKGNSGWYYSGWSGINTYIRLKNISLGETSFVNKANSTYTTFEESGIKRDNQYHEQNMLKGYNTPQTSTYTQPQTVVIYQQTPTYQKPNYKLHF